MTAGFGLTSRKKAAQRDIHRTFRQLDAEAALVELGDRLPLQFIAFVDEGEAERKADIAAENLRVLGPGDHGTRAHHGRDVAVHEGVARQIRDPHHLVDDVAPFRRAIVLRLGQHDLDLVVVRQIIERGHDRPAIHLRLIDLLRAVIEAGGVAEADGVGGREQPERRMRADHAALVEQREAAGRFQHALDHEHHVRAAGVVFVEAERDIVLVGPRQDAVAEFRDLLAILDDDRILADQIDAADVAVEVDAHARPVEPCGDLLDMRRLAGAVIARDDDAPVARKAREDRKRRAAIEAVILIDVRHMVVRLRIGRHFHVAVDSEHLPDRHLHVGQTGDFLHCGSHCSSVASGGTRGAKSHRADRIIGANLAETACDAIAVRRNANITIFHSFSVRQGAGQAVGPAVRRHCLHRSQISRTSPI